MGANLQSPSKKRSRSTSRASSATGSNKRVDCALFFTDMCKALELEFYNSIREDDPESSLACSPFADRYLRQLFVTLPCEVKKDGGDAEEDSKSQLETVAVGTQICMTNFRKSVVENLVGKGASSRTANSTILDCPQVKDIVTEKDWGLPTDPTPADDAQMPLFGYSVRGLYLTCYICWYKDPNIVVSWPKLLVEVKKLTVSEGCAKVPPG